MRNHESYSNKQATTGHLYEADECVVYPSTMREPKGRPGGEVVEEEELLLHTNNPMVALLGLLETLQVLHRLGE